MCASVLKLIPKYSPILFLASSVTRYWSKNVAQMFAKVAQLDATVVFT